MSMTALSDVDRLFVEQRRSRKHVGLYVMPIVLILLIVAWGGLFVLWPLAVNPITIWNAPNTNALKPENLSIYAMVAAVLVNLVFVLLAIIVLLRISWSRAERRYLRLLDRALLEPPAQSAALAELPVTLRQ
ncbi:MAG: hypothetical protein ABW252_00015 [Polyangiales bacterium]